MKLKQGKLLSLWAVAVFIVLRVLQYAFAMDDSGFFVNDTLMGTVLSYALYVCMGAFVVCALVFYFTKRNRYAADIHLATKRQVAYLALAYAVTLLIYSGFMLVKKDWMCVFTFTAALYYILLALRCDQKNVPALNFMALFALAYPCARVIEMFFNTFKEIKASENVITALAQCSAILAVIVMTKLFMEFDEKMTKIGFFLMLGVAFGGLAPVSAVLDMIFVSGFSTEKMIAAVCDAAFWGLITALLHRCSVWTPALPEETTQDTPTESITEEEI